MNVICNHDALVPFSPSNTGLWSALNRVSVGACILDRNLCFVRINQKLSAMTGLGSEACVGLAADELMPNFVAILRNNSQGTQLCEAVESVEVHGNTLGPAADGRIFVVSCAPILSDDGPPEGVLICFCDVTERKQAEAAARERDDDYRYSLDLNPQIAWAADADGKVVELGSRWLTLMGMSREEMLGDGWVAVVHQDDIALAGSKWSQAISSGEPYDVDYRLRLADGAYRWFRCRGFARRDGDGQIVRWYGTAEDIHDRKSTEEALAARSRQLEQAQWIAKLGDWSWKVGTQDFHWSKEMYRIHGRDSENFSPTLDAVFADLHPEDREGTMQRLLAAIRDKANYDHDFRVVRPDGSVRYCWAEVRPLLDDQGHVFSVHGICQDITARKLAEKALRESEEHYRYSVELSPHIPLTMGPDGQLLEIGPRIAALSELTRDEIVCGGWVAAVHPADRARYKQERSQALKSSVLVDQEYRVRTADGDYRWVRSRAAPRRDADGRIVRWYGAIEEIHDRKMAEAALKESEVFARSVLDNSPDCMQVLDLEGRFIFVNAPGLRVTEIECLDTVRGLAWDELWPAEYRPRVKEAVQQARAGSEARFSGYSPTATGKPKWWDVCVSPIPGPDGEPVRLLAVSRDVTDSKRAQDEINQTQAEARAASDRLAEVLESTTDGVVLLDREWRVTYINPRATALLASRALTVGRLFWDAFPEEFNGNFHQRFLRVQDDQAPVKFDDYLASVGLWLETHAYPASNGGLSIFFHDITEQHAMECERAQAQERVAHMARHDALTGLANRLHFREQLDRSLDGLRAGTIITVLYLDLDGFKAVNDTHGHPIGDLLLRQVAERLQRCVRQGDLVARFGGDEFAVIQTSSYCTSSRQPDDAAVLADRLIAAIAEPYDLEGKQVMIATSVGIALAPRDGTGADDLIRRADLALYAAKAAGRGRYRLHEWRMDEELREKQALKADLRAAIEFCEFKLHYQPVLNLRTNRIACFEALLRWQHPQRGLVPPDAFISVAEENGLILPIGTMALRWACQEAAKWPEPIGVAVNLSPIQFCGADLISIVADVLATTNLAPERLELEITESVLLKDSDGNLAMLRKLKKLGVRIAMDDFGTGYSSLSYLHRFPFDKVKIDRSFVAELPHNRNSAAIVNAVMGIGASLGVTITAEGVETQAQLAYLRAAGCDQAQGFLFSKAVPKGEVAELIERLGGCEATKQSGQHFGRAHIAAGSLEI